MSNKALRFLLVCCCLSILLLGCGNKHDKNEAAKPQSEVKTDRTLEYAWASCTSLGNDCLVVIWIRGRQEDTRLVFKGAPPDRDGLCHVEIPKDTFHKHFKYCMLSGISAEGNKPLVAQFGGGPAGERDFYWFEWGTNVRPNFYCILR